MGGLFLIGLIWFICQVIKDANIKHVPPGTDYRQAYIDSYKGVSGKEMNRRLSSGYYVKKNRWR